MNLIRKADLLFEDARCNQNVVYYYNVWQEGFDIFDKEKLVNHWVGKAPTSEDFKEKTEAFKDRGGSIVVIDDFGHMVGRDVAEIFT